MALEATVLADREHREGLAACQTYSGLAVAAVLVSTQRLAMLRVMAVMVVLEVALVATLLAVLLVVSELLGKATTEEQVMARAALSLVAAAAEPVLRGKTPLPSKMVETVALV